MNGEGAEGGEAETSGAGRGEGEGERASVLKSNKEEGERTKAFSCTPAVRWRKASPKKTDLRAGSSSNLT